MGYAANKISEDCVERVKTNKLQTNATLTGVRAKRQRQASEDETERNHKTEDKDEDENATCEECIVKCTGEICRVPVCERKGRRCLPDEST